MTIIKTYSPRNNYSDAKDWGAGWGILNHCLEVVVPAEKVASKMTPDQSEDMLALELHLHGLYQHKRLNGEWFNLDEEDVESILSLGAWQ